MAQLKLPRMPVLLPAESYDELMEGVAQAEGAWSMGVTEQLARELESLVLIGQVAVLERIYRKLSRERFRSAKLADGVKRACRHLLAEVAIVRPLQVGLDEGDVVILPAPSARERMGLERGSVEWSAWAGIRTVEWIYRVSTPKGKVDDELEGVVEELEALAEEGHTSRAYQRMAELHARFPASAWDGMMLDGLGVVLDIRRWPIARRAWSWR